MIHSGNSEPYALIFMNIVAVLPPLTIPSFVGAGTGHCILTFDAEIVFIVNDFIATTPAILPIVIGHDGNNVRSHSTGSGTCL